MPINVHNEDYETNTLELRHHNRCYDISQLDYVGEDYITVYQLINYLKTINQDAKVVISSDHGTVGYLRLDDIRRWDVNGYEVGNEVDEEEENEDE